MGISDRTRAHSKMAPVPSAACSWRASNHLTRTPSWSRKLQQSSRTPLARSSLSPTLGSQAKPTLSNRINVWSACKATARRTSTKSERKSKTIKVSAVTESAEEMYELAGILSSLDASSSIQLVYVGALLGLLSGAVFLVVRQVLFRTQLEEATKELSAKARTGDATYDEYYELGVLLIRKKLFATALKHLDSAKRSWEGDEEGLAQLYNAMGYAYLQQDKLDSAVAEYLEAVNLRPRYVVAWNNLGDAYKKMKKYEDALEAYETTLGVDPDNKVAKEQFNFLKSRVNRLSL